MAGKSAGTVKIWNDEKGFGFIDPSGTRSTATSRALIAVGCVCSPCAMPGGSMLSAHNMHRWHACKRTTGAGGGENVFVHRANVIGTDNRPVLARGMQVVPSSLPPFPATAPPLAPHSVACVTAHAALAMSRVVAASAPCLHVQVGCERLLPVSVPQHSLGRRSYESHLSGIPRGTVCPASSPTANPTAHFLHARNAVAPQKVKSGCAPKSEKRLRPKK